MEKYFNNANFSSNVQILIAFLTGFIFSPWSLGFLYFILFLIFYELMVIYYTNCSEPYWKIEVRIGILASSMLGFLLGKLIVGANNPFKS